MIAFERQHAAKGRYENRRFTVAVYDQWVAEKPVLEKIAATYKARVQVLKDKIVSLKAEIAKGDVANSS